MSHPVCSFDFVTVRIWIPPQAKFFLLSFNPFYPFSSVFNSPLHIGQREIILKQTKEGRFRLTIRKKFFTLRMVRHWHWSPREMVDVPSLEAPKVRQDGLWEPDGAVSVPVHCRRVVLNGLYEVFQPKIILWFYKFLEVKSYLNSENNFKSNSEHLVRQHLSCPIS